MSVNPIFQRLALITGEDALERFAGSSAIVFGAGGVGSWCAEALVRCGIGRIAIVDHDTVCESNINRQIQATTLTVGMPKADVLKKRFLEINPQCDVIVWNEMFNRHNAHIFGIEKSDYVIDAIDSISCKLDLIEAAGAGADGGLKFFSSMGMARKSDPSRIKVASIWETKGCPLARAVRQGLRKRGFSKSFTVVYSDESLPAYEEAAFVPGKKTVNGSAVPVTASAGMFLAGLVLRDICDNAGAGAL
ncbi:MAG: tRNA threonylcarbamoyladenosine dehydratase [Spirochaetes bacterium]|nr:tRNA threonylcarbamoyladenosine dehydratase [Spirochaetota bacterium]